MNVKMLALFLLGSFSIARAQVWTEDARAYDSLYSKLPTEHMDAPLTAQLLKDYFAWCGQVDTVWRSSDPNWLLDPDIYQWYYSHPYIPDWGLKRREPHPSLEGFYLWLTDKLKKGSR